MKKKLLATILSSALVVSMLAGCGSTAEAPAAEENGEETVSGNEEAETVSEE